MNRKSYLRDIAKWLTILLTASTAVGLFAILPAFASGSQQTPATPTATFTATPTVRPAATTTATPTRRAAPTRRATPARQATPTRRVTPTPLATATPTVVATLTNLTAPIDGLATYTKLGCGGCHRLAAANAVGGFGPTHEHIAATAAQRILASDYTGAATTAAEFLAESIRSPEAYIHEDFRLVKYRMPNYDFATDEQVAALVEFLMQQE